MTGDFDSWERETLAELGKMSAAIDAFVGQAATLTRATLPIAASAGRLAEQLVDLGSAPGTIQQIHQLQRRGLRRVLALTHDTEIAVRPEYMVQRMGLDLARLFEPILIELGPGNSVVVEQNGTGEIVHQPTNPCHVLGMDQLGVDVPIRLALLGNRRAAVLNSTLSVRPSYGATTMFTSALERGVGICPRDVVRESMRIELTRRADAEIGARMVGAGMPIPADVDIGLGRPTFYGSAVDQHFRFYGTVRRRARAELRDLAQLPDWADLGIKFASSLVVSQIESEISKYGGAIVGGPTFHGGRSFDLVGRGEERKTIKIACVEFGIVVTVTARLRCSLNVHGSRIVDLTVTEVNRNVDTDIKPFTPPGIGHLLEGLISSAVSRLIPAMNYNRRFVIESAERVDIQIDGAALRVFVKMP